MAAMASTPAVSIPASIVTKSRGVTRPERRCATAVDFRATTASCCESGASGGRRRRRRPPAAREAAASGAQGIGFAELAFEPFYPQHPAKPGFESLAEPIPGPVTHRFSELAAELGVVIVLNLFERAGDKTYDSSPVIDADGQVKAGAAVPDLMLSKQVAEAELSGLEFFRGILQQRPITNKVQSFSFQSTYHILFCIL